MFEWENGTKTQNAIVTGDGVTVQDAVWEGETPISASNLNLMQSTIFDWIYPIGSYYETSDTTFNPNVSWRGTWVEDTSGRVTVAQDSNDTDFDTIGETGGNKNHTLTQEEEYWSNRGNNATGTGGTGGYLVGHGSTQPFSIVQPYVVVKRWHRTA